VDDPTKKPAEGDNRPDIKAARGWASLFYFLANDDILKVEECTRLRVNGVFNFLAYKKDKAKLAELEHQRAMNKIKLKK